MQLNSKSQSLTEIQTSNADLQTALGEREKNLQELEYKSQTMQFQINKQSESLTSSEKSNQDLQLHLNEKNLLLTDTKKEIEALRLELNKKNESLTEIRQLNQTLHLHSTQTNDTLSDVQKSVVELQSELGQRKSALRKMEESHRELELQLCQAKGDLCEAQKSIDFLNTELSNKNLTLAEVEQLKAGILESIVTLESDINKKDGLITELEKRNSALQSELRERIEELQKRSDVNSAQFEAPTPIESIQQTDSDGSPTEVKTSGIQPKTQINEENNSLDQLTRANEVQSNDVLPDPMQPKIDGENDSVNQSAQTVDATSEVLP